MTDTMTGDSGAPAAVVSAPAELVALLASEVAAGLQGAALTGAFEQIAVDRVVLRLGEPAADFASVAWQTEVELVPELSSAALNAALEPAPPGTQTAIPEVLAKLPVRVIDGVSEVWSERLRSVGVGTVGDLAALDLNTLAEIAEKFQSRRPLAFGARARACAVNLPSGAPFSRASEADSQGRSLTLGSLLRLSPDTLRERFQLSRTHAQILVEGLHRLSASLDLQALDALRPTN